MASVPAIITKTGGNAPFAYDEFLRPPSTIRTHGGHGRVVDRFLNWWLERRVELLRITPGTAGDYIGQLEGSAPTKDPAFAALRHFFDALVQRHVVPLNSFTSVRGIKHSVTEGKTPEIGVEQAKKLFRSLNAEDVVGLRDQAMEEVFAYSLFVRL